jgi:hypothetical protein
VTKAGAKRFVYVRRKGRGPRDGAWLGRRSRRRPRWIEQSHVDRRTPDEAWKSAITTGVVR